ncbi:MAG: hypothetical protein QM607_11645 [Microbacterium sp.]
MRNRGRALTVVLGAAILLSSAGCSDDSVITGDDYTYPYDNLNPAEATDEGGGVYSGAGQALIRLDEVSPQVPLQIALADDDPDFHTLYATGTGAEPLAGSGGPVRIGVYGDQTYVVPAGSHLELWVDADDAKPWRIQVSPAEITAMSGEVEGSGDAVFQYTGEATTARVSAASAGDLSVDVVTVAGTDGLFTSYVGILERSVAWADTPFAIFVVEDYGEDESWTIDFGDES